MYFLRKTSCEPDIRLFRHRGQAFWYGLLMLALIAAPSVLPTYYLSQLTFICIFTVAGAALMLLSGFTGQVSLGHAAFLGIGAYTEAIMQARGIPFFMSLPSAMVLSALAGIAIGLPALRMSGIYLAVATMAFGFIVEEVLTRWDSLTLGTNGMTVAPLSVFGKSLNQEWQLYAVCLAAAILAMLVLKNLMRSPTGRAFVAIRDSEISAQSMGIHLARYKTKAFAISAALTGLAGALYAHKVKFLSPDQFGIVLSVEMMMMIIVGGLGSLHGAVFGALFLVGMPQLVVALKDQLPPHIAQRTGLELTAFGLVLLLFVLFEPLGIYGRWMKIRLFLETFPLYRKGTFKRQRSFTKSDRLPVSLLKVERLSINFGGLRAVDDVSFEVKAGEVYTIIGPNGAGKTTLFNMIGRIYPPSAGQIVFDGQDITALPPHRVANLGIARTFQNIELFDHATVLQNLLVGRQTHRKSSSLADMLFLPHVRRAEHEHRAVVEKVIDFLNLPHYRDQIVAGLPYGVRKVVELARALAMQPRLLLLDEPSSGLNPEERGDMAFWIEDLRRDLGITVLMVEHDMGLVSRVSDRVLALNAGRVIAEGTPLEVQRHPEVIAAYLGG